MNGYLGAIPLPILCILILSLLSLVTLVTLLHMNIKWNKDRVTLNKMIDEHNNELRSLREESSERFEDIYRILPPPCEIPLETEEPEPSHLKSSDESFIKRLNSLMEEHMSDENFNVSTLTMELGMSRTGLFTKMKNLYGVSPQAWITNRRLNRAMELLKTREYNVSEVSDKVGFATITGFSRSFKNKFGASPSSI